jgi:arabinofuranosyltransferase
VGGSTRSARLGPTLGLALLGLGALAVHAHLYLPFLSDDALISLRYARRLLQGHGLTWTEGRPVEGYSNLLWVLASAGLGALGVELVAALRVLGFAGHAAVVGALLRAYPAVAPASGPAVPAATRRLIAPALGIGVFVLAAPVGVWTVGGLEQPLLAALLAWALVFLLPLLSQPGTAAENARRTTRASLCLALLCWTRPDGPLFAGAAALVLGLVRGRRGGGLPLALRLLVWPALFVAAQTAFRLAYYGEWVPNTALVKLQPSAKHMAHGFGYVARGFVSLLPVAGPVLAASLALAITPRLAGGALRARLLLLLSLGGLFALYLGVVGGDIFPAFRHWVPLLVLLAFATAEMADAALRSARPGLATAGCVGFALLALPVYSVRQWHDFQSQRARAERFEWEGREVGLALAHAFGDAQPLIAVTSAGAIPYWSQLPALDMLGLTDHHIAHHPPADFGEGKLAHELGDADYILERAPDLLFYHVGMLGSNLRIGQELNARPEFRAAYLPVRFAGAPPAEQRFEVWVRRESPKVGVRRSPGVIEIPGYLFTAPDSVAPLQGDGHFEPTASRTAPLALHGLPVPPGRWRVEVESSFETRVRARWPGGGLGTATVAPVLEVPGPGEPRIDLELTAPPLTRSAVRGVTLVREEG